jgi:hypothetical protein
MEETNAMREETLSDFHHDPARGCLVGHRPLPSLAGYGARPAEGSQRLKRLPPEEHPGKGFFRVELRDEERVGPTPEQERALAHLLEREEEVCAAVLGAVLEAHRAAYEDCHVDRRVRSVRSLKALVRCAGVEVARRHLGGQAYLGFHFYTDWPCERGLCVVFHPQRGAWWDDARGLDRLDG